MPDPIATKRLKKKMLDRWENEGGAIAAETRNADDTRPKSEGKNHGKKLSSQHDNSTIGAPAFSTKRRKPTRK
jgi:hypothetical protein